MVEQCDFKFFGKDDLAVELVDRLSPGIWAERVVVDAQTTVETRMSLCLYSTPFTFYPTALLLSLHSKLPFSC